MYELVLVRTSIPFEKTNINTTTKTIESSKVLAEKINGLAAIVGLSAAIGSQHWASRRAVTVSRQGTVACSGDTRGGSHKVAPT